MRFMLCVMKKQTPSLRERKKERTRELLVDTANRLFLEQGFDKTTVDQIAEAAGVSQRTFFRYFPAKDDVVFSKHAERIARFKALLVEHRDGQAPAATVRAALADFARDYQRQRREMLREWRIVTGSPLLIARDVEQDLEFEAAIVETLLGDETAGFAAERRARIIAGAIFGAVRATMQEWYSQGCREDLVELGLQSFQILEAGVAGQ